MIRTLSRIVSAKHAATRVLERVGASRHLSSSRTPERNPAKRGADIGLSMVLQGLDTANITAANNRDDKLFQRHTGAWRFARPSSRAT